MSTPLPTAIPHPRTDLEEELIGDELFIRDLSENAVIHCLNSGAAMIWYLCDGARDLQAITNEIAAASPRPAAEILPEVVQTVVQFQELKLLSEL